MSVEFVKSPILVARGLDTYEKACAFCHGGGYRSYGSGSTWRGGIGGAAITTDVCDQCWGSGVQGRPWPSHRTFENLKKAVSDMEKKK